MTTNLTVDVMWFADEAAYYVGFSGEAYGIVYYWRVYVPDNFVISENGNHRLIESASQILVPLAELNIEMSAVKREREKNVPVDT